MAGQPLRRTSDRVEAAIRRACITLAVLGLPLEDAPDLHPTGVSPPPFVEAEWTGADRIVHQGKVQVPEGSEAGYELMVWTTESGELADAPQRQTELVIEAGFLAFEIMLGIAGGRLRDLRSVAPRPQPAAVSGVGS